MSIDILLYGFHSLFFEGRSNIREYIFLFLLLFLSLLFYFVKKTAQTSKSSSIKTAIILITLSWLIFHTLTTSTQIFIFKSNNLSLSTYGLFFNGSSITSSEITHSHLGKTFTNIVFKALDGDKIISNIDSGGGLDNLVPGYIKIIGLSILIFFAILNLYIFIKLIPNKNWLWTIAFSLIFFATLKGMVDGGIFSRSQIVNFSILLCLIYPVYKYKTLTIGFLTSILIYSILNVFNFLSLEAYVLSIKMAVLFLLFGLGLLILLYEKTKLLKTLAIAMMILSVFASGQTQNFTEHYEQIEITPSDTVFIKSKITSGILTLENLATTTVKDLAEEEKLLTNRAPIQIPWKTCFPSAPNYSYNLSIISFDEPSVRHEVRLDLSPCTPSPMNVLHEELRAKGFNNFLIYNLSEKQI